jgi:hypothetical protein
VFLLYKLQSGGRYHVVHVEFKGKNFEELGNEPLFVAKLNMPPVTFDMCHTYVYDLILFYKESLGHLQHGLWFLL